MTRDPAVGVEDLIVAYRAWPGSTYDKAKLHSLVLRVRIERAVAALPATVIAAPSDSNRLSQRLLLSLGAPDLDADDQTRRLPIVMAAIATYGEICDLLHGRNPDPNPPLQDVAAWSEAVRRLETEMSVHLPRQQIHTSTPPGSCPNVVKAQTELASAQAADTRMEDQ